MALISIVPVMKKTILLPIITCWLLCAQLYAQKGSIDSLKQLLQGKKADTSRVQLLNQLAFAYLYNRPDTAFILSQQALILSKKNGYEKGEVESLRQMGTSLMFTSNYEKALELHLVVLKFAEKMQDQDLKQAMLTNIGIDYGVQGDYVHGVSYALQALALAQQLDNKTAIGICLANLGDFYEKLNVLDSARMYTNMGYDMATSLKHPTLTAITLNNLGNIYSKMGQDAVAMANYQLCLPVYVQEDDVEGLCEAYLGMAKLFRRAGNVDSSLYYGKLSLANANKLASTARIMNASAFLMDLYISERNVDSAFVYQSATMAAKDTLFSQEKQKKIQNLTFDETMRQQDMILAEATKEKERRDNIQFAMISVGIVSFIILTLLLSRTVIVSERWIRFLGVLGLLLFFEFINLFIHPYIGALTHHSPLYSLLIMVVIASILIPLHHKIEHRIKERMVVKNRRIRLAAARKTVAQLEAEQ